MFVRDRCIRLSPIGALRASLRVDVMKVQPAGSHQYRAMQWEERVRIGYLQYKGAPAREDVELVQWDSAWAAKVIAVMGMVWPMI